MTRFLACGLAAIACATSALASQAAHESSVGMPARIEDLVLPAPELEAVPVDSKSSIVLRVLEVRPHGTDFRYDLEYRGLDPGQYDLRDSLRPKNGAQPAANVPSIPVTIRSVLADDRVTPSSPLEGRVPRFGGYRALGVAAAIPWVAGLVLLIVGRKRKLALQVERARPRTLAERLRPLVERAMAKQLSRSERAQLELGLVAYWRRKLGLEDRAPAEALALLKADPRAGPLLESLERWLHAPGSHDDVDLAALLEPYRDLPADALESARAMEGAQAR